MKIVCIVNGERRELEVQPLRRLLDVLREDLGLTGTKEGCGEGECGACAVHIDGRLMNACQVPAFQVHGRKILTVEGLGTRESPDPLQAAFVTAGAVQCGFCTPGLLMASRALLDAKAAPTEAEIRAGLAGNLCRCTGYGRVVEAVRSAAGMRSGREGEDQSHPHGGPDVGSPVPSADDAVQVFMPNTLAEALAVMDHGEAVVMAGGTDLMAAFHAGRPLPDKVLDISRLRELTGIMLSPRRVTLGAAVSYTDLLNSTEVTAHWPALAEAARQVGAPAVQNMGTVGGNLVNASPGADLVPVLAALDGVVVLASTGGERRVPVLDFYKGYRDPDRRPDELVAAVELPRPAAGVRQAFFKAGTRRAQSIARVNLACCARIDTQGRLTDVKLVAGSVGPTIVALRETMAYMEGRRADEGGLDAACRRLASGEVHAIDDVRASADYRRQVLGNLVTKFVKIFV